MTLKPDRDAVVHYSAKQRLIQVYTSGSDAEQEIVEQFQALNRMAGVNMTANQDHYRFGFSPVYDAITLVREIHSILANNDQQKIVVLDSDTNTLINM